MGNSHSFSRFRQANTLLADEERNDEEVCVEALLIIDEKDS